MFRVSEALKRDHREVEDAYFNIVNATDNEEKTRWQQTFSWGLASHSIGEELVVYPAMEEYVPNGKEMADKDRKEHQEVSMFEWTHIAGNDLANQHTNARRL